MTEVALSVVVVRSVGAEGGAGGEYNIIRDRDKVSETPQTLHKQICRKRKERCIALDIIALNNCTLGNTYSRYFQCGLSTGRLYYLCTAHK